MFIGVCPKCGEFNTVKSVKVQDDISYSVCENCGNLHAFVRLPLFVIIGASGSGKTSICLEICKLTQDIICLDGDTFLPMAAATKDDWDGFRYLVMEVCTNISQYGRPVALFHSGMPEDYKNNRMAKFFQKIVPIGIYADEDAIVERLRNRPEWRKSRESSFINDMIRYNKAVSEIVPSINTTGKDVQDSAYELVSMMKKELDSL